MDVLQHVETPGKLSVAPISPDARLPGERAWSAVLLLPLAAPLVLGIFPALNIRVENHRFHFQIVTADTLDAITTHRPYRAAQSFRAAFDETRRHRGTQFDPHVVEAFLNVSEQERRAAALV